MIDKVLYRKTFVLLALFVIIYICKNSQYCESFYEFYNMVFGPIIIPTIYCISFIILLCDRLNYISSEFYLTRIKRKSKIIFDSVIDILLVSLRFVFLLNTIIVFLMILKYGQELIGIHFLYFIAVSICCQFFAWVLVGSIYLCAIVFLKTRAKACVFTIASIEIMCLSSSFSFSLKKLIYDINSTIVYNPFQNTYLDIVKKISGNVIIAGSIVILAGLLNQCITVYGRTGTNEE